MHITGFAFAPDTLKAHAGDTLRWTNDDIVPHTATAVDESWDTGKIKPGPSGEIKVTADMHSAYFYRYHPMMKAKLRID